MLLYVVNTVDDDFPSIGLIDLAQAVNKNRERHSSNASAAQLHVPLNSANKNSYNNNFANPNSVNDRWHCN